MTRPDLRAALRWYGVTRAGIPSSDALAAEVSAGLRGGLTAVQLRQKEALAPAERALRALALVHCCRALGALSIINDDVELALSAGADGVHLGASDGCWAEARRVLGPERVLGATVRSVEQALRAQAAGADYVGVGPIFDARDSKEDAEAPLGVGVLRSLREHPDLRTIPIVAIGGIDPARARQCFSAGADGVAAIRGFFGGEDVRAGVAAFVQAATV